ncbi:MAG TPA: nucleotidyltransferase domain-containing protein [Candidatus Limnocylindrales bacterium]
MTKPFEILDRYLERVDAERPGLIEMLYVVGSIALGAWQPGRSDIDTIIVTSRALDESDLEVVKAAHMGFDGRSLPPGRCTTRSRRRSSTASSAPVVWLVLARHGITVRGPAVAEHGITVDAEALRSYNLDNLRGYWQPLANQIRKECENVQDPQSTPVPGEHVAWMMLGPPRLHHTLATGAILSKAGSAGYLREVMPEFADLADRAVRWRAGEPQHFTLTDLLACADATDAITEDAHTRFGVYAVRVP